MINDNNFFSRLWNCFRWHEDRDPADAKPENSRNISPYQLRQLERCLEKDCEIEINRKQLERQWQRILSE